MKSALVTGATGFTGSALCERLIKDGWRVTAFARPSSSIEHLARLGVDCCLLDITDRDEVLQNFPEVDVVFHIAAAYRTEHADREEFTRVNVDATVNLLEAAKAHNIKRFVHCSTVGVQGNIEDPPADEDYRFAPADHYQQSKMEGELAALRYFSEGLPGAVVRPTAIYGPGDTRFLKLFKAINSGAFVMIGNGRTLYHMNYIDDLVEGFLIASHHPNALGEVFILGGDKPTSISELVAEVARTLGKRPPRFKVPIWPVYAAAVACEKVCNLVGVSPPLYPRRVEFFEMNRAFSIDKARNLLQYEPSVDLRTGLERTANWYRDKGLL
ncbi:MAG: NAD-dependent epimerase/dehydratase family protein [Gammaproteobacteria bacterium]|nr:NAD-dependent epimerase/dehydratase family protein [Gammaproteobacteria bacterium]NNL51715.1 NAD-dependent epimerase/dehydratase family protein [Woeseiaceae bacterium]